MQKIKPQTPPPKYLAADECAARYAISTRHWHRQVDAGLAPQPTRFGRSVRWSVVELEAWEAAGCRRITRRRPQS